MIAITAIIIVGISMVDFLLLIPVLRHLAINH